MNKNLQNYSIGIVTYINRYHTYFKPNVESLIRHFPDKQIICIINGHPDKMRHLGYLKEATQWLSTLNNVQYVTFEDHQSLARCWNWVLLMSYADGSLFLNDDIMVKDNFRDDFENCLEKDFRFFAINNSFSHFFVKKRLIREVGWFDERFLGIGYEDGDYLIRMAEKKIPLSSLVCRDIINYVAPGTDPSFQKISGSFGKYSDINREFLGKKWLFNQLHGEDKDFDTVFEWNGSLLKASLLEGMGTPMFYDYALLDDSMKFAPQKKDLKESFSNWKKLSKNLLRKLS